MTRSIAILICALPLVQAHAWKGLTLSEPALSLKASCNRFSSKGCMCAPVSLYSNERTTHSDTGSGCVGGCGGEPFQLHKEGGIARSITIWYGTHVDENDGIKAIRIAYFGDLDDHVVGHPEYAQSSKKITFNPGETIKGDVALSGNGFGSRAGYVAFETSGGQKFAAGQDSHTKYIFDSGNSFISGIYGRAGGDINQLAFIFWKPIQAVYYLNIVYPTLDSHAKVQSPTVIASSNFCNDNSRNRTFAVTTLEKDETTGHDSCFSSSFSEDYGANITVNAGIPGLVDITAEAHWDIAASQEFKNCEQHSSTTKATITFPSPTLLPHTRTSYQYTQWQGTLSALPYTATLQLVFQDGQTMERTEKGTYKGTSYLSVQQSWTKEEKNVKICNGRIIV